VFARYWKEYAIDSQKRFNSRHLIAVTCCSFVLFCFVLFFFFVGFSFPQLSKFRSKQLICLGRRKTKKPKKKRKKKKKRNIG
jgi:hypothetical protein